MQRVGIDNQRNVSCLTKFGVGPPAEMPILTHLRLNQSGRASAILSTADCQNGGRRSPPQIPRRLRIAKNDDEVFEEKGRYAALATYVSTRRTPSPFLSPEINRVTSSEGKLVEPAISKLEGFRYAKQRADAYHRSDGRCQGMSHVSQDHRNPLQSHLESASSFSKLKSLRIEIVSMYEKILATPFAGNRIVDPAEIDSLLPSQQPRHKFLPFNLALLMMWLRYQEPALCFNDWRGERCSSRKGIVVKTKRKLLLQRRRKASIEGFT